MPDFIAPAMMDRFDSEVSMMTGVRLPESRILASIPGPSRFGIVTSRMTRSYWQSPSFSSPWTPSSASATSKPRSFTCFETMVRTARLSSTVRTVGMAISPRSNDALVDPEHEPQGVGLQDDDVRASAGHGGCVSPGQDLGEPERLVERHHALQEAGGHVDELAQRVVHHGLVDLLLWAGEHRRRETGAPRPGA